MTLSLRITVADVSPAERATAAEDMGVSVEEVQGLAHASVERIAERIEWTLASEPGQDLIWEGAEEFLVISAAEVIAAAWNPRAGGDGT